MKRKIAQLAGMWVVAVSALGVVIPNYFCTLTDAGTDCFCVTPNESNCQNNTSCTIIYLVGGEDVVCVYCAGANCGLPGLRELPAIWYYDAGSCKPVPGQPGYVHCWCDSPEIRSKPVVVDACDT
jgi:hypothetical protein